MPSRQKSELLILAAVIILDQLSKFIAIRELNFVASRGLPLPLLVGGLFIFVWLFFKYLNTSRFGRTGLSLIVGGALSNLLDRLGDGYVTDFINMRISTVNLADIAIALGILVLFVYS